MISQSLSLCSGYSTHAWTARARAMRRLDMRRCIPLFNRLGTMVPKDRSVGLF